LDGIDGFDGGLVFVLVGSRVVEVDVFLDFVPGLLALTNKDDDRADGQEKKGGNHQRDVNTQENAVLSDYTTAAEERDEHDGQTGASNDGGRHVHLN